MKMQQFQIDLAFKTITELMSGVGAIELMSRGVFDDEVEFRRVIKPISDIAHHAMTNGDISDPVVWAKAYVLTMRACADLLDTTLANLTPKE